MKTAFLRPALFSSCLLIALACIAQAACSDDSSVVKEAPPDSGKVPNPDADTAHPGDGGDGGAPSDCVLNPQTHLEIINACTNAVRITKNPVLAKLLPDGGLPPTN